MDSDKYPYVLTILAVITVALILFLMLLGSNFVDSVKCRQYHNATGRATRFVFWPSGQCYVNTKDGWILKDQIQIRSN